MVLPTVDSFGDEVGQDITESPQKLLIERVVISHIDKRHWTHRTTVAVLMKLTLANRASSTESWSPVLK